MNVKSNSEFELMPIIVQYSGVQASNEGRIRGRGGLRVMHGVSASVRRDEDLLIFGLPDPDQCLFFTGSGPICNNKIIFI